MRRLLLTILLVGVAVNFCSGQSFVTKYPRLTKSNLKDFFVDWKAYSDSVGQNRPINDSAVVDVIKQECAEYERKKLKTKYRVVPEIVDVERYNIDIDSAHAESYFFFQGTYDYASDSITSILPDKGLYLTPDINRLLSEFAGGIKDGDKITKINKGNLSQLAKYIPVNYGHWGGYWWFESFPMIEVISYFNNFIIVSRRTSWCTGDAIWYIKENDRFVRQQDSHSEWIQ